MNAKANFAGNARVHLTHEQVEEFGYELDKIRDQVMSSLGEKDAAYIRKILKVRRNTEISGRALLFIGFLPPAWLAGSALLGISKILENMEIGHNVMHGQWDWLKDPRLQGQSYEWDTACPSDQWRHSHNYMHHTFTNIVGKDRDVGYGVLRMSEDQPWKPWHLFQHVNNAMLATFFQWGVALHDLEVERLGKDRSLKDVRGLLRGIVRKGRRQVVKDYVLFPALSGPFFLFTLSGNVTANLIRNYWAYMIIFCGHFPDGVEMFDEKDTENETRGQWYLRQAMGSCNIEGSRLMHIMSGHLSHQIEHHLFPDMPAHRYAEIGPQVRELCEKYGVPYNTGSLGRQFGSVLKRITRLSFPNRLAARFSGSEQSAAA